MRPKEITLSSVTNTVVPVSYRNGPIGVTAVPTASTYTVEFTTDNVHNTNATVTWIAVTNMSAATTTQSQQVEGPITALRVAQSAGTSTKFSITQRDFS